jgi:hypothetical protein
MRWVSSTVPHLVSLPMQFHLQFMFNLAHAVHDPLTAVAVVPSGTLPLQPQSSFPSPKRLELICLVANGLLGSSLMWRCYQLQPRVHDNDDDNNGSDDSDGQVAVSTPPPSTTAGRTRRPRHRTTLPAAPLRRSPRNKTTSLGDRLELLRFGVWHPAVSIIRFGTIRCSPFTLFSFLPPAAPRPMNNEDGGTVFIFLPAAPWQTLKSPLGLKPSGVLVYAHV